MVAPFFVLLPLYVYPSTGAWDPIIDSVANHTSVRFKIIINPNNGPGSTSYPDSNYISSVSPISLQPRIAIPSPRTDNAPQKDRRTKYLLKRRPPRLRPHQLGRPQRLRHHLRHLRLRQLGRLHSRQHNRQRHLLR